MIRTLPYRPQIPMEKSQPQYISGETPQETHSVSTIPESDAIVEKSSASNNSGNPIDGREVLQGIISQPRDSRGPDTLLYPEVQDLGTVPASHLGFPEQDLDKIFQDRFHITYKRLTRVQMTAGKRAPDPKKARFYLSFPSAYDHEREMMMAMLRKHTLPNLICSSRDSQGWDSFNTVLGHVGENIGVIIVCKHPKSYNPPGHADRV